MVNQYTMQQINQLTGNEQSECLLTDLLLN
jgi:hypothetical protein